MSLINDALKKAKQAPKVAPPPSRFRTAAHHESHHGSAVLLTAGLAIFAAGLGAALMWFGVKAREPVIVHAAVKSVEQAAPNSSSALDMLSAAPSSSTSVPTKDSGLLPVHTETAALNSDAVEMASPSIPVETAPPVWPKLQGIFYATRNPSAVLNGKSVFIGGRVGEFVVAAIERQSVTVVGAGLTNVLSLSD